MLWASDFLHVSPLLFVVGVQIFLYIIALLGFVVLAGNLLVQLDYWILFLSSGFFAVSWAAHSQGAGRKELISFAVFGVLDTFGKPFVDVIFGDLYTLEVFQNVTDGFFWWHDFSLTFLLA